MLSAGKRPVIFKNFALLYAQSREVGQPAWGLRMGCRAAWIEAGGGIMNSWAHGDCSASVGLRRAPGWKDFDLTPAFSHRGIAFECVPALSLALGSRQRRGEWGRRKGGLFTLVGNGRAAQVNGTYFSLT